MIAQPPPSPNLEPAANGSVTPPPRARSPAIRLLRSLIRWTFRLIYSLLILLLAVMVYLGTAGFPESLTTYWLDQLREQGFILDAERIRLDVVDGLSADNLRMYESAARLVPIIEADEIGLQANVADLLRRRPLNLTLRIRGGFIRLNMEGGLEARQGLRTLALERVNALIQLTTEGIRANYITADFLGIQVQARGFVARGPGAAPVRTDTRPGERIVTLVHDVLARHRDWLPQAVEQLNQIQFETPPMAELDFSYNPAAAQGSWALLNLRGAGTRSRGVYFDKWNLDGRLRDGQITVTAFNARQDRQQVSLTGAYNLTNRMLNARFYSSLHPAQWLKLLPARWCERFEQQGCTFSQLADCELWIGPAPLTNVLNRCSGWIALQQADLRGLWVEKAFAAFERADETVRIERFDAVLGRGAGQGPVTGRGHYNLCTRDFSGHVEALADPNGAVPLLHSLLGTNSVVAEYIERFKLSGPRPSGVADFSGVADQIDRFGLTVRIAATNFSYRGVPAVRAETVLRVTNNVLSLDPLRVVRAEGEAQGTLAVDFDGQMVLFDLSSGLAPPALGKIIGPPAERFLEQFRWEGPVTVVACGRVGYDSNQMAVIEADVDGEKLGMNWMLADQARFHVDVAWPTVSVEQVNGRAFGGAFSGQAILAPVPGTSNFGYDVSAQVDGVQLVQVVRALGRTNSETYVGTLSVTVQVAGCIGLGQGRTARGAGRVQLDDGHLFQIPLMWKLSQLLSLVHPGFGYAVQTDFTSDFRIRDGRIETDRAFLEGNLISVMARGSYSFDQRLDFNVQVKLLRGGPVAYLLRFVTLPVTKLMELHLGGTAQNPVWRPGNLPKELFQIFQ